MKAFRELDAPSPPILLDDHARNLQRYPPLLRHIAWLMGDIKQQTRKATRKAGEVAVRQTITQVVSALHRRHLQLFLLSELESTESSVHLPPGASFQVEKILERIPGRMNVKHSCPEKDKPMPRAVNHAFVIT